MSRIFLRLFVASACAWCATQFSALADAELESIRAAASKGATAMEEGDHAGLVATTYPLVIEMLGGREKATRTLASGMADMKAKGFRIVTIMLGDPGTPFPAAGKDYSIVPMTMVMENQSASITVPSFLLAISTDGRGTWTFVDGSSLTPATRKLILPDLPPDKLPPKQKTIVEPKQ